MTNAEKLAAMTDAEKVVRLEKIELDLHAQLAQAVLEVRLLTQRHKMLTQMLIAEWEKKNA